MKKILLACLALLFFACSDSDEYLYEESSKQEISIEAYMTRAFKNDADKFRADTILLGDSLIFFANVWPSKAMHFQKYYWTMDGVIFANEFSFRKPVTNPGLHEINFVLIDHFGDTLVDTMSLAVSSAPLLDQKNFIPATGTQNIGASDFLSFAWNAEDPDHMWDVFYHFTLESQEEKSQVLVDTILEVPYFKYIYGFNSLTQYRWKVQAFNQLGIPSLHQIAGNFGVAGVPGENAITGVIKINVSDLDPQFEVTLMDSINQEVSKIQSRSTFNLKPIPNGNYKIAIVSKDYPDFKLDPTSVQLQGGKVFQMDTLVLKDNNPPYIQPLMGSDTLDYADTLRFIVRDDGGPLAVSRTFAKMEQAAIPSSKFQGDTLIVPLKNYESSWSLRILTITTQDNSGNKAYRYFYIRPNKTLSEVIDE